MRVYELSKQLGISTKDLIRRLSAVGIQVASHMAQLSEDDIKKVLNPGKADRRPGSHRPGQGRFSSSRSDRPSSDRSSEGGGTATRSAGESGSQGRPAHRRFEGRSSSSSSSSSSAPRSEFRSDTRPPREAGSGYAHKNNGAPRAAGSAAPHAPGGRPPFAAGAERGSDQSDSGKQRTQRYEKNTRDTRGRKNVGKDAEKHGLDEAEQSGFSSRAALKKRSLAAEQEQAITYEPLVVRPMSVAEFCESTGKSINDVIVYLLKKGIVAPKTAVISEKVIADLVEYFQVPTQNAQVAPSAGQIVEQTKKAATGQRRAPVVVVVGHVDHGKTTLLDTIRKTRVAEREKGGITQHLGAYQIVIKGQKITMLDTPGHEAFSLIRVRGMTVADVAILVVAADDGVMPQTVEAIKRLQETQLPIIVALNKIDKASPAQVEAAKRGLNQYGLVPEEWGGSTPIVPISAKLGRGVDELLDLVVLQSELLDLFADPSLPAQGVVLESKMERGRGPVATVICHQGTLRVGDYFIAGSVKGKVSALLNEQGVSVKQAALSEPVSVSGFERLPTVGSVFDVVTAQQARTHEDTQANMRMTTVSRQQPLQASTAAVTSESQPRQPITLVVRSDNMSSQEAILNAISAMSLKVYRPFTVLFAGIGGITESDIELAAQSDALVFGFHVKIDKGAQSEAQRLGVVVVLHDIIYKMLEDLQARGEKDRPIKKVWKKVGEAVVLKVFDIKSIGIVAGVKVLSGKIVKEGKLVVHRGKYQVGQGPVTSLQKDRKTVKEITTGHEGAFMAQGFDGWLVDDHVDCLIEVPE